MVKERVVVILPVNGRASFTPTSGYITVRHGCTLTTLALKLSWGKESIHKLPKESVTHKKASVMDLTNLELIKFLCKKRFPEYNIVDIVSLMKIGISESVFLGAVCVSSFDIKLSLWGQPHCS